jgi:hypothetical protein
MPSKLKLSRKSEFNLTKLCTPSAIYFIISIIGLIVLGISNLNTPDRLCIGDYSCYVGNNTVIFILNAVYIVFWTFILDLLCKNGYSSISWFILLLPIILTFIFYALILIKSV